MFRDGLFSLVYLDGNHAYRQFSIDLANAMRLVQDGGVVCGDDMELPLDAFDVDHANQHREEDYIQEKYSGIWFHAGIALRLKEVFSSVSMRNGFWAMRKQADTWTFVDL